MASIPQEQYVDIQYAGREVDPLASKLSVLERRFDAHIGKGGNVHAVATQQEAGFMSPGDKEKLDGVENGATQNANDAFLLNRGNHEGEQPIESVTGLRQELDDALAGGANYRGLFVSLEALQDAIPVGAPGNYADVDPGEGVDAVRYIWDESDQGWVSAGEGEPLTAPQVKALYESNPNTNALTDSRLASIDDSALLRPQLADAASVTAGSSLVGHLGRNIRQRLTDEIWAQDQGMVLTGATGTATAEGNALIAAMSIGSKPIKLNGGALRATISSIANANILLDNMYRLYINAGQLTASATELPDVRIDLPAGKISRSKRVRIRASQHSKLQLRGAPRIPLSFVSATRSWISTVETSWNITFADASQVAVGDYINCTELTGSRSPAYSGMWPVTAVSGNIVTLRVSTRANNFSVTFAGGTFEKVSTIIEFDNSLGMQVSGDWMGSSSTDSGLIDIGIVSVNPGSSQNGIYLERNAKLSGLRIGIHGFASHNYYALPKSSFECAGFSTSASGAHGAYPLSGSYFGVGSSTAGQKASLTGNALYGLALAVGSIATTTGATISGNGTSGVVADDNSTLVGFNMTIEANGLNGTLNVGGGITGLGRAVLSVDGTSSRFNSAHSIRLLGGAMASLGNGTYNGSLSGTDVIIDDPQSFYTSSGATIGVVSGVFVTQMKRANVAYNFGSIPANSEVAGATVTIPGITSAMNVEVNSNLKTLGVIFTAHVSAADTVTIYALNATGSAISVGNRTFYVLGKLS